MFLLPAILCDRGQQDQFYTLEIQTIEYFFWVVFKNERLQTFFILKINPIYARLKEKSLQKELIFNQISIIFDLTKLILVCYISALAQLEIFNHDLKIFIQRLLK